MMSASGPVAYTLTAVQHSSSYSNPSMLHIMPPVLQASSQYSNDI